MKRREIRLGTGSCEASKLPFQISFAQFCQASRLKRSQTSNVRTEGVKLLPPSAWLKQTQQR